jgi:hypothetical protein
MKCIRCKKEREIPGFCQICYKELYGLSELEPIVVKMEDLVPNERHLELVERNYKYTDTIRKSIEKDGLKNPIIIDNKNRILIGHHRYFLGLEFGWEEIPAYIVKDDAGYNKFIEGGLNNLFIIKVDGKITGSVTRVQDLLPIMNSWILATPFWKTSQMVVECFTGIGATNDPENWKKLERTRADRFGGKRNLAAKR